MSPATLAALHEDVALAARGDREAFGRVVTATSGLVTAITAAETRDLETSRDAAQEAYLHAWRDLSALRNPSSFLPWLRELARRRAREAREKLGRLVTGDAAANALEAAVEAGPDAAQRLLAAEERRALAEAMAALPDDARETVVLYYREGRSAAQVARLLGLSEEAVWQRLTRARAALRADLLARAGDVLERTTPGAAFTAAVLAALGTGLPTAAGAATATGVLAKGVAGAAALSAFVVGAAGAAGSLAMRYETRLHLEHAEDESERAAVRRAGGLSQAALAVFAVAIPVLAGFLRASWLFVASFGLYAISLTLVQLLVMPRAVRVRVANPPWGRGARVAAVVLGLGMGVACLVLAARLRG
ncbi:MAG: RNA polymerase sigma factor [Anaeromyxobacteraceae bacterium]